MYEWCYTHSYFKRCIKDKICILQLYCHQLHHFTKSCFEWFEEENFFFAGWADDGLPQLHRDQPRSASGRTRRLQVQWHQHHRLLARESRSGWSSKGDLLTSLNYISYSKGLLLESVAFKLSCILLYISSLTVKKSSRYEQMRFILFLDQSCLICYMSVALFIDMIMSRMWLRLHIIFDGQSFLCLTFSLFVRFPFLSFLCLHDLSLYFFR